MYSDFVSYNIGCKAHNQHYILLFVLIICIMYYSIQ